MSRREPTEEEKKVLERLMALSGQPVDYSDPDCPKSEPGRKWHRGLPSFLSNKKIVTSQESERVIREPAETQRAL